MAKRISTTGSAMKDEAVEAEVKKAAVIDAGIIELEQEGEVIHGSNNADQPAIDEITPIEIKPIEIKPIEINNAVANQDIHLPTWIELKSFRSAIACGEIIPDNIPDESITPIIPAEPIDAPIPDAIPTTIPSARNTIFNGKEATENASDSECPILEPIINSIGISDDQ